MVTARIRPALSERNPTLLTKKHPFGAHLASFWIVWEQFQMLRMGVVDAIIPFWVFRLRAETSGILQNFLRWKLLFSQTYREYLYSKQVILYRRKSYFTSMRYLWMTLGKKLYILEALCRIMTLSNAFFRLSISRTWWKAFRQIRQCFVRWLKRLEWSVSVPPVSKRFCIKSTSCQYS